jgi:AraC-like DNA-binding protein
MPDFLDIDGAPALAFGLSDEHAAGRVTGFHRHQRHQLLYCSRGALRLTVAEAQYVLPPARAAWLPAGTSHDVASHRGAALRTIYFSPVFEGPGVSGVFPLPALGRELVMRAMQFSAQVPTEPFGEAFFTTLAGLVHEWAAAPMPIRLPRAQTPEVAVAMSLVLGHIDRPPALTEAARAAGVHPRTLRRRFQAETGAGYREFVRDARILSAMDLLSDPTLSITEVAFGVGYETPSAFAHAFREVAGVSPRQFRSR